VAAGEQHPELVVGDLHLVTPRVPGRRVGNQQRQPFPVGLLPPQPVQGPAVRRGVQPRRRALRHAGRRPGARGGQKRVLQAVLGQVEAAQPGDEQGEQA
jgi:hypothetical protein